VEREGKKRGNKERRDSDVKRESEVDRKRRKKWKGKLIE
jgi:hypothetical protein